MTLVPLLDEVMEAEIHVEPTFLSGLPASTLQQLRAAAADGSLAKHLAMHSSAARHPLRASRPRRIARYVYRG